MIPLVSALLISSQAPQDLHNYLAKPDPSFAVTSVSTDKRGTTIQMTSQTWHGIPWKHSILLRWPANGAGHGTGILYVTGDGPFDGDYRDIALMSAATNMPVAMLFNIPNQPLWGMKEDDLIAHTFEEYLKSGDPTWPLLFPMAKSALRAMDAVEATSVKAGSPIHKFVVTGASKRGWTTWMAGASGDPRIIGIAPMVYDNLNVGPQMSHQIEMWGAYSEMIQDYTRRGLQQELSKPRGKVLARMIDPYSYRADIHMPTLIVKGANDPYWTTDATSLYWNQLKQPHWLMITPNAGHDLAGGIAAAQTIGAFSRALAGEFKMPKIDAEVDRRLGWSFVVPKRSGQKDPTLAEARLWEAESSTLDFRKSHWSIADKVTFDATSPAAPGKRVVRKPVPGTKNIAAYVEMRFQEGTSAFSLCTPIRVVPLKR